MYDPKERVMSNKLDKLLLGPALVMLGVFFIVVMTLAIAIVIEIIGRIL